MKALAGKHLTAWLKQRLDLDFSEYTYDDAKYLNLLIVTLFDHYGVHGGVGRLQDDPAGFGSIGFYSGFAVQHGYDNLAGICGILSSDENQVP